MKYYEVIIRRIPFWARTDGGHRPHQIAALRTSLQSTQLNTQSSLPQVHMPWIRRIQIEREKEFCLYRPFKLEVCYFWMPRNLNNLHLRRNRSSIRTTNLLLKSFMWMSSAFIWGITTLSSIVSKTRPSTQVNSSIETSWQTPTAVCFWLSRG